LDARSLSAGTEVTGFRDLGELLSKLPGQNLLGSALIHRPVHSAVQLPPTS
jgi:hypothetical protein